MLTGPKVHESHSLAQQLSRAFRLFGALVASAFMVVAASYGASRVWLTPEYERSRLAQAEQTDAHASTLEERGFAGEPGALPGSTAAPEARRSDARVHDGS